MCSDINNLKITSVFLKYVAINTEYQKYTGMKKASCNMIVILGLVYTAVELVEFKTDVELSLEL